MFAKTLLVAAASAAMATAYSMPACWETCFQKYDITSEGCLCSAPMESVVTSCISVGCPAANSTSSVTTYEGWLSSYCGESTGPVTTTEISTAYTTVCPLTWTSTTSSAESTWSSVWTSSYTTSTVSTVVVTTVPVSTTWSTVPVTSTVTSSTATVWTSGAITTSTWVPSTWVVTMTPGVNTWTGVNSVAQTWTAPAWTSPVAPTTTGGSWTTPATVTPPPYVAGAAGLKVGGVLGAVGAAAALLL